ncbi:MAG: SDR family NAD(P)-dependent oxidoreductase, partial [Anaerolineales bacterium]
MNGSFDFTGKVALVTGAGRGIGKQIAIRLASCGATLIINDVIEENAKETSNQIKQIGGTSMIFIADVSDSNQVENMVKQSIHEFGHIDILVNNAGISLYRP